MLTANLVGKFELDHAVEFLVVAADVEGAALHDDDAPHVVEACGETRAYAGRTELLLEHKVAVVLRPERRRPRSALTRRIL